MAGITETSWVVAVRVCMLYMYSQRTGVGAILEALCYRLLELAM